MHLTGPNLDITQSYALPVQPGTAAVVRRKVLPLEPGQTLDVTADLTADLIPGTGTVSIAVQPLAALDVPTLLKALDRYPYGCSEQIVSRAMPLLYVNKLAESQALALDGEIDGRIRDAIERVLARQDSAGSFGLWSVGGGDVWLDAFVTDFLTRARERGFTVPKIAFDLAVDHLRNQVANQTEVAEGKSAGIAYAVYVLARNGRPVMGDLRYLADTKINDFASPLARAQIAAGLGLLGDRTRAQRTFGAALERLVVVKDDGFSRPDYGSQLRDGAAVLALALETGTAGRDLVQRTSTVIEQARTATRSTSTQENAWLVLAAEAAAKEWESLSVKVDGEARKGPYYRTLPAAVLESRAIPVTNTGSDTMRLVVGVNGNPVTPEPAAAEGYGVERAYYTLGGEKVDPSQLKQNDRVVVVLTVTERVDAYARLLLVDRLPAGLEIDNPSLVDASNVAELSWLKRDIEPVHTEYRDDRFVAAFDRSGKAATYLGGLCGAGGVARPLRPPGGGGGGHVPARALRPQRHRHAGGGAGEVRTPSST